MMLGHLMEWMFSGLGGIRQAPGSSAYDTILIEPEIVGDISWVETTYNSIRGRISSSWKKDSGSLEMKVHIPAGSSALIIIPQADASLIKEGEKLLSDSPYITLLPSTGEKTRCRVGSGDYYFSTRYRN